MLESRQIVHQLGEAFQRIGHLQQVLAAVYRHMGIDPESVTLEDRTGRPQYVLEHRDPIKEIVG